MSNTSDDESQDSVEEILRLEPVTPIQTPTRSRPNILPTPRSQLIYDQEQRTFPPIISLNVGGVVYMTRLSTLLKYPDSMLATLFSGRHQVDKDKDGHYFIDSNGQLFGYILDFLRHGTLPPNDVISSVYREANYFGLHTLTDRLQLRPPIVNLMVKEAHRTQFPNYYAVKEKVIRVAMENGVLNRSGEVAIYAFKTEFVPKQANFNANHGCVVEGADIVVGPWTTLADEEALLRCIEGDLTEDGFNVKMLPKKKCRYYYGQTCHKFLFKLSILFE